MTLLDRILLIRNQDRKFRRRQLQNALPQERRLWKEVLRKYRSPASFIWKWAMIPRNHMPVDFFSPDLWMTIDVETDAESRGEMTQHEANRRSYLRDRSTVYPLFIPASEIDRDIGAVREYIDGEIRKRMEYQRQRKAAAAAAGEKKN